VKAALLFVCIALAAAATDSTRAVRECARCHPAQSQWQPESSMAHALELVHECTILQKHPVLTFKEGVYNYRIEQKDSQTIYSISDGQQTLTFPIGWAFGQGIAGQTYVFESEGEFYQTRVSYYREIDALDLTLGAANIKPRNINEAIGIRMARQEQAQCFGCHATNAVEVKRLVVDKLIAGVQCERCHGSTENHLKGLKLGDPGLAAMPKLSAYSTEQISTFCGQCHRTWEEIASAGQTGISNVRFQPYRLTNSKCYDTDDKRISCVACHDPHKEIVLNTKSYDSKCLACHAGGKPAARACRTAKNNCASCHMPQIEIPGSHHRFYDHEIRIVKANVYPD
jgi:hypothetical protein